MIDPAFWRGRRVLLTGHTGFKGAWLALWLEKLGALVTGFGAPPPSFPALSDLARVEGGLAGAIRGDVRDAGAVADAMRRARPEIVLHLAAQALVRRSLREPVETFEVNVIGTAHVLEAVRSAGEDVRAVVSVTSDKCYLNRGWEWPYREDDPLGGKDPYSSSKACQELVTAAYRDSLLAGRGVRVATARAGNAIGGGDWAEDRLVPDLVRAASAQEPLQVRSPRAVRPWQHVLNPLSGYLLLAQRLCGEDGADCATAWNFGPSDDAARPVSWVVERLRKLWPAELDVRMQDEDPVDAIEAGTLRVDSSRARERLGWAPRWRLEAGLDATITWYARHAAGEDARALTLAQIESFEASSSLPDTMAR